MASCLTSVSVLIFPILVDWTKRYIPLLNCNEMARSDAESYSKGFLPWLNSISVIGSFLRTCLL